MTRLGGISIAAETEKDGMQMTGAKTNGMALMFVACMAAGPAHANDSTAQLAAGGLVLTKTDAIEMQAEDLHISRKAIRVRYRFVNTSGHDATVRVAFPMPDIGGPGFFDHDVAVPVEAPANILGFTTLVDGQPVRTAVEQKAIVGSVDRTAWLSAHQIPLAPHLNQTEAALARLPIDLGKEATKLGLIDEAGTPAWILRTTYHWLQPFPAGKPVTIEHRYTPSVGGTVMTGIGEDWGQDTVSRYCVEPSMVRSLARSSNKGGGARYAENWLDYILVTGGNWKKPIGDFRLVVDKDTPATLISFCGRGVRKIGPTTFEMRKQNWRPQQNLAILFLVPLGPDQNFPN